MEQYEWNNKEYIDKQLQSALFILKDRPINESRVFVVKALKRMDEMMVKK